MDALECLRTRQSIRSYKNKPVSKKALETLVDAGRLAATTCNYQQWEFVVITNPDMKKKIADITAHGKFIADSGACIIVFYKEFDYYLEDGCAATQNILLAAKALGLGTCWIGGDKSPYCREVADMLGVPKDYKLISFIAVGHPEEIPPRAPKRSLKEVIHWEKF